ncbi:MAG: carboxylate--amine ligase [Aeromicrobium sp.]|nr:carboxylate--amine ligase [Aeromicrobium sp.]
MGVEEEMFLVDPTTGRLAASSDRAVAQKAWSNKVEQELFLQQIETQSDPQHDMSHLLADLRAARRDASHAAEVVGARLAAMPTPVMGDHGGDVTHKTRYEHMMTRFGRVGREALVCGMHVHVDIADDEEGVAVLDRLRAWFPLVMALAANSPFDLGADTAYASWRGQIWEAWPSAGAVEPFGDAAGYQRAVAAILASGAALDEGMIYFDARLSRHFPTIEVRVADVCTDLDDTVLVAAVVRALVDTCASAWHAGDAVEPWRVDLLRAARWRARRDGLGDALIDPISGVPAAAADVMETLLRTIGPALDRSGDARLVEDGITRLLRDGTGSALQRAVAGPGLDLRSVVEDVLDRTAASWR